MRQPTLKFGQWTFTPGFMSSLSTLLILPLLVYLGFWQLDRGAEKMLLQQQLESGINREVLVLGDFKSPSLGPSPLPSPASGSGSLESVNKEDIAKIRYRQLKATGILLNNQQILLDNQIYQGKAGYHLITPMLVQSTQKILLIDRGWIPVGDNRNTLPIIQPILETQTITGTINKAATGIQLKKIPIDFKTWPIRVQRLDFNNLAPAFEHKLYPFMVQLRPNDPLGFKIEPIVFRFSAKRHLGYAIQWFTMALAVLIYFLVINVKRTTYGKR